MRRARCSRRLTALGVTAALLSTIAFSPAVRAECGCLWRGSFADVQGDADLVVAGRVESQSGNSVDLHIEKSLRGDAYRERIRIWLRARDYCRPPVETFPEGSHWVMALARIEAVPEGGFDPLTPNISYGREGDYTLSECGGYWLDWSDSVVTGALVDAPRWAREPEMTPVLLELVEAFVRGEVGADALRSAAREDPAVRELMLDTKQFLRYGED